MSSSKKRKGGRDKKGKGLKPKVAPPDYFSLPLPKDKPLDKYRSTERRAYMAKAMVEAGHPKNIPWTYAQMAEMFGIKSTSTIFDDMERVIKSYKEYHGRHLEQTTGLFYEKSITELTKVAFEGDRPNFQAIKLVNELLQAQWDWMFKAGMKEKAPDKVQHQGAHVHFMIEGVEPTLPRLKEDTYEGE